LSTGGGFSTRTLYKNDEETIFSAKRPIIITGIGDVATRGDLLDRALLPPPPHRINAYAIHGQGTARRYLALHPVLGDEPDFHRLECFREVTIPGA
jgi:hypothetical protein